MIKNALVFLYRMVFLFFYFLITIVQNNKLKMNVIVMKMNQKKNRGFTFYHDMQNYELESKKIIKKIEH